MSFWREQARLAIEEAHKALAEDCSFADRKKAIAAAYPFGPREYHPYKIWLSEQRKYLEAYIDGGTKPKDGRPLSPLERAKNKALWHKEHSEPVFATLARASAIEKGME